MKIALEQQHQRKPRSARMNNKITERIDAITGMTPEYTGERLPPPKSVKIELTARCDFNCFFCASGQRLRDRKDMDFGMFMRLAKEMREVGVQELGLFYLGESFMLDWLPEAIRYAKEECGYPYAFLTTNGRLSKPDIVERCIEAGLDSLKFSFNNATPEQLKAVAQVKPDIFYEIIENIKGAREVRDHIEAETGHRCGIYASSIQFDGKQAEVMAKAVEPILPYVDEHYYLPLYGQSGHVEDRISQHDKNYKPTAGNQGRIGALRHPVPCWSAFTEGHVTYDGKLSACCFDHDGRFEMGDLTQKTFMEAWNSDTFIKLRRAHLEQDLTGTVCEKCVAYE